MGVQGGGVGIFCGGIVGWFEGWVFVVQFSDLFEVEIQQQQQQLLLLLLEERDWVGREMMVWEFFLIYFMFLSGFYVDVVMYVRLMQSYYYFICDVFIFCGVGVWVGMCILFY